MLQRKFDQRPIRKRSFLLFELLLSMGLLLLCLFPLIKTHVAIARVEMQEVLALQEEQKVQRAFIELKIALHEHAYRWQELMQPSKSSPFSRLDHSSKNSKECGLVLEATLPFGEKIYKRTLYVEKTRRHTH